MNTEELCAEIKARSRPELIALHNATGIAYSTLEAIKRGRTTDPRGSTCDRLRAYFENGKADGHR